VAYRGFQETRNHHLARGVEPLGTATLLTPADGVRDGLEPAVATSSVGFITASSAAFFFVAASSAAFLFATSFTAFFFVAASSAAFFFAASSAAFFFLPSLLRPSSLQLHP
jgi:hypothetical protein